MMLNIKGAIMKKERDGFDLIREAQEDLGQNPVTKGNDILFGRDGKPLAREYQPSHMDPAPYEPDDKEHCPFCGRKATGFCSEQCENDFYGEDDLRAEDEKRDQEKRDSI